MTDQPDFQGRQASQMQTSLSISVSIAKQGPASGHLSSPRVGPDPMDLCRMVGEGEWKDYAIDHLKDKAVFSRLQTIGEMPLYRIEKNPKLASKQGAYSVVNTHGMVLKRGHELKQVLKVFDKVLKLVE